MLGRGTRFGMWTRSLLLARLEAATTGPGYSLENPTRYKYSTKYVLSDSVRRLLDGLAFSCLQLPEFACHRQPLTETPFPPRLAVEYREEQVEAFYLTGLHV